MLQQQATPSPADVPATDPRAATTPLVDAPLQDFDLESALFPPQAAEAPAPFELAPVTDDFDLEAALFGQPEIRTAPEPEPVAEPAMVPPPYAPELAGAPSADFDLGAALAPPEAPQPSTGELVGVEEPAPAPAPAEPAAPELPPLGEDLNPEAVAARGAALDTAREQYAARESLDALDANRQQAAENQAAYEEAIANAQKQMAEINAEAEAIANQPINTDLPAGKAIAGMITAALSGFMDPGGANAGLQAMDAAIDRQVNLQLKQRRMQLGALDRKRAGVQFGLDAQADLHKSAEAMRIGLLRQADKELAAKQQLFHPDGTTAQNIAEARVKVQEKVHAAEAAAEQQAFENQRALAAERLARGRLALQRREFEAQQKQAELARQQAEESAPETAGLTPAQREVAVFNPLTGEALRDKGGTPFEMPSKVEARSMRDLYAVSVSANRLINDMLTIRKNHQYESGWKNDPEYQAASSKLKQLHLQISKTNGMGALDSGAVKFLEDITGSTTGWLDNTYKLRAYREGLNEKLNDALRGRGYQGATIRFPSPREQQKQTAEELEGRVRTIKTKAGYRSYGALKSDLETYDAEANSELSGLRFAKKKDVIKDGFDGWIDRYAKLEDHAYEVLEDARKSDADPGVIEDIENYARDLNFRKVQLASDRDTVLRLGAENIKAAEEARERPAILQRGF